MRPPASCPGDILLRGLAVVRPALRLLLIPDCDMYGSGLTPSLPTLPQVSCKQRASSLESCEV